MGLPPFVLWTDYIVWLYSWNVLSQNRFVLFNEFYCIHRFTIIWKQISQKSVHVEEMCCHWDLLYLPGWGEGRNPPFSESTHWVASGECHITRNFTIRVAAEVNDGFGVYFGWRSKKCIPNFRGEAPWNGALRRGTWWLEENIKSDLRQIVCEDVNCNEISQDSTPWRALVFVILNRVIWLELIGFRDSLPLL
jgi:hypothetical protein